MQESKEGVSSKQEDHSATIAELDEQLTKFEGQKRWSDYIRTLARKAELVSDPSEKVELWLKTADLYIEKSSNQAEAIKCLDAVLAIDEYHPVALERLRVIYDRRRDWDKLVQVMRKEAEQLGESERLTQYADMARMAVDKMRKPELAIDLWELVLKIDPTHEEALQSLVKLYERARKWDALAVVLEQLIDSRSDATEQANMLQTLGMIYADKLSDDAKAITAFRRILEINPQERRAQEQLKRRYAALKAWDELESFYEITQKWDELIRVYEREAELPERSNEEKIDLLVRSAKLWQTKLNRADRTAHVFEKILALDPNNLEAAQALTPAYERGSDPKKLYAVYAVQLKAPLEPEEHVILLLKAAALAEKKLNQPEKAFEHYLEAVLPAAMTEDALENAERLAATTEQGWDKLSAKYRSAIDDLSGESQVILRVRLASILAHLGKTQEAIDEYQNLFDQDPTNLVVLQALQQLYAATDQPKKLKGLFDHVLSLDLDDEQRREVSYQRADLLQSAIKDVDAAIDAYNEIIAQYGDQEERAYVALDALLRGAERWEDLAGLIERRLEAGVSDQERAQWLERLAEIKDKHQNDRFAALQLYRELLMLEPEHANACAALEGMLTDSSVGQDAAEILEPIYEVRGDWTSLMRVLQVTVANVREPMERVALWHRIGQIAAMRLNDNKTAFDSYASALREVPSQPETLAALDYLAQQERWHGLLVELLEDVAGKLDDPEVAKTLWAKAGTVHDVELQNIDAAIKAYTKVQALAPEDPDVLTVLESLYQRAERWSDLLTVLYRRAELATDPNEKELLLTRAARAQVELLGDLDASIRTYQDILSLNPSNEDALVALDELYQRKERWGDLADHLTRRMSLVVDPDDQTRLMLRLAHVYETRMGVMDTAIEMYRDVLDRDVENKEAVAALERLLSNEAHQHNVATILESVYQRKQDVAKLIGLYDLQVSHTGSREQRIALLHKVADLYEMAQDDPGQAFASYARALAEDPLDETTRGQLERLSRTFGDWQPLVGVYESLIEKTEDPEAQVSLRHACANIYEHELGQNAKAIEHYQVALSGEGQRLETIEALERLYQKEERYEDMAANFLRKAELLGSGDGYRESLFQAAFIYEDMLDQAPKAIEAYQRVLAADPEDLRALDKLIEHHLRARDWDQLLKVYQRKINVVVDLDERKRIYFEIGAVYERELKDIPKAIDTYQHILEIDPDDIVALSSLDRLYAVTENWKELLSVLERQAELVSDEDERVMLRYRVAELWERKLDDPQRAIDSYRDILESYPEHSMSLAALEGMVNESRHAAAAVAVLEPVLRSSGSWDGLLRIKRKDAENENDTRRKVELLHEIAEIEELQQGNSAAAFATLAQALPYDAGNAMTLDVLERLADDTNNANALVNLYRSQIASLESADDQSDTRAELAMRAAYLCESRLGDVDQAIDCYQIAVANDPKHTKALEALSRLYEASDQAEALAKVIRAQIDSAASADEALELQFRLGQIYQMRLNNNDQAIACYRDILAAAPDHQGAMASLELLFAEGISPVAIGEVLEPIYRSQEAWGRLIEVYRVQIENTQDATKRVQLMHRIAETAEMHLSDPNLAFEWMGYALKESPANTQTAEELSRLTKESGAWEELAQVYADIIESDADKTVRLQFAMELAGLYETMLADTDRAEATYRFALGLAPDHQPALEALDKIYSSFESYGSLTKVLRRRIALTQETGQLRDLNYRLARLLAQSEGTVEEAIKTYELVLEKYDSEHVDSLHGLQAIYSERADWDKLLDALKRELDLSVGDTAKAEVLALMARIATYQKRDHEQAVRYWRDVLERVGEDVEALNALGNLYAEREEWNQVVELLEREAAVTTETDTKLRILNDLGRVWYDKLQRERNAVESFKAVLDIDPVNADALFNIADIQEKSKQYEELASTLHRIIDVAGDHLPLEKLKAVFLRLGHTYKQYLERPVDGADAYRRALEVEPTDNEALENLEQIYRDSGQWEECITILEKRANLASSAEEQEQLLLKVGSMWAENANQPDEGVGAFERVLQINANSVEAFKGLESLHRDAMRWEELIELYLQWAERAETTGERVDIIRRIADVYEKHMGDTEKAFEALQLAWSEDYTNKETAAEIERLAALTQKWNELLSSANEALAHVEDKDLKIAICLNCARWYGVELGHPEYAIPYYQQILALDPGNVPAMRQMVTLYRITGQWDLLAQVLGRLVEMVKEPAEKADVYVEMGTLCEHQLGYPDRAPGYYAQALEIDARNMGAITALERVYEGREQWDDLLAVLQRKVDAATNVEESLAAQIQVGELYEFRFENPANAIRAYQSVHEREPENLRALHGLERLYTQSESWPALLEVLEKQYELVTTEKERIDVLTRLATMYEEQFRKPDKAAERLEQVLDVDPADETALRGLSRMYKQMQRWDDVVRTYERHILAVPARAEKVELYKQLARVQADELRDYDRAVDTYLNALDLEPEDKESLTGLAELRERKGDHAAALDVYERLVDKLEKPADRVNMYFRSGRIIEEKLGDRARAIDAFRSALDIDPEHVPSLEALRSIYTDTGDWLDASRILEQLVKVQSSARDRARCLVELGRLYKERLDEPEKGLTMFERALQDEPENEDAAQPLVDEYVKEERWQEALPLLQAMVLRVTKREPDEQHRLNFLLGQAASHVGQHDVANKAYARAYQLDAAHVPSLTGLAASHYALKEWEKAFKFYQMLLVHHRSALAKDEVTDTFYRLGVIKREQGERRKALSMFDKALEEDAHHRPTLEALVELYQTQGDFEHVIQFKTQIAEMAEVDERHQTLIDIGELWSSKLNNPQKAIQALVDAMDIKPDDHRLLHKLLGLYQDSRQWQKAIEIIERISDLDERPTAKSKYMYTIGVILRDELKNSDEALARFDEALDMDPTQLRAFESLNKILTQKKEWKELERAFRKMLHRVTGKGDYALEFNLWHNLGLIYRDRLQHLESAAEAFSMASRIKPEDATEHQILAELYMALPSRLEDAVREQHWILSHDSNNTQSIQTLYKLYFDTRQYDKAWCVASALSFLKLADKEQNQFFEQYRNKGMIRPVNRVDNELWLKCLMHPTEDILVGKIFETVTPAVLSLRVAPDKQYGLNKKHQVDPATSTAAFAKAFSFVAQVLSLPMPRLFLRPDVQGGLAYAITAQPASVCGSSLLMGVNPQDLIFVIAKHLSYYRGEHYVRRVLPTAAELKLVLLAALRLMGVGPEDAAVDEAAKQLGSKMQPVHMEALKAVVRKFVEAGAKVDIKEWIQAVELSACRAGFLVANDLDIAARMIAAEPSEGPGDMSVKEKVREMILFSVSEQYFRLRESLGIQLQIG